MFLEGKGAAMRLHTEEELPHPVAEVGDIVVRHTFFDPALSIVCRQFLQSWLATERTARNFGPARLFSVFSVTSVISRPREYEARAPSGEPLLRFSPCLC